MGGTPKIIVTEHNTLNGTAPPAPETQQQLGIAAFDADGSNTASSSSSSGALKIAIHNNLLNTSNGLKAYVTGRDMSGAVVMLNSAGKWYYPNAGGSAVPIAIPASADINIALSPTGPGSSVTELTIPDYIESGRVYICDGELPFHVVTSDRGGTTLVEPSVANPDDPSASLNWGFIELTNLAAAGIFANISFVDFVGLVMAMKLTLSSGETQQVRGLEGAGAVQAICDAMCAQAAIDGQPWDAMCVTHPATGAALRVLAPNLYVANPGQAGAMRTYYDAYVDAVWQRYAAEDLLVDTQSAAGVVACRVRAAQNNPAKQVLACAGDNREYVKPLTSDIWGCNTGPFAIVAGDNAVHRAVVPRLCAAFTRSELVLPSSLSAAGGGDNGTAVSTTPRKEGSAMWYKQSPTNHYSRIVHEHQVDGKGYAFSYDDVEADGKNAAGVVAGPEPTLLEIFVGGTKGDDGYPGNGTVGVPIRRRLSRLA
ncbi:hypothetical protein Micbo1qcDRAFT_223160 [Microdochium bolleyi]|uniref:GH64 domain-containing protein n=1 Tax=Microdochium bolleyi TaxID=196109 RepID=A0A136J8N1_9PEZI|nr:hypothetical protein Micbo1qcDRAFT_223160 [Microdochium bolleyi]